MVKSIYWYWYIKYIEGSLELKTSFKHHVDFLEIKVSHGRQNNILEEFSLLGGGVKIQSKQAWYTNAKRLLNQEK